MLFMLMSDKKPFFPGLSVRRGYLPGSSMSPPSASSRLLFIRTGMSKERANGTCL
jgi:hypothetical protein